ncbi:integrase arm-type DNA-binding domain-containing protein [Candidatus Thioglobus sp.]|jgi:L-glutamine-phosphate cytidylyltransferase|nr:integrase arm-type DNA-binding domain-containing protein [Candidatus Thioglobus sp.]
MFNNQLTTKIINSYINSRDDHKSERLTDGMGLWLRITSSQSKQFRYDYSRPSIEPSKNINGKRNTISIGSYPLVSLKEARQIRDQYKSLLSQGIDPSDWKKNQKKKNFLESNTNLTIKEVVSSINVKSIIIAAGLGSRLKGYTEALPKCMLMFGDKTLLERQLEVYEGCGIKDISVVRGFKKEKINYEGLNYYDNTDYHNNNILNSLFYAEEVINGNVIISYSDILFDTNVVSRLLESNADISIVVDIDWRGYYVDRKDHPIEEAEKVIFDANNEVLKIGKVITSKQDVYGEFIGMLKLSPRGAEIFKLHFNRAKKIFWDKPFQRSQTFQKAYITDLIQDMVEMGVSIHCVIIERGWKEIDTVEDYEKAIIEFKD